MGRPSLFKKYEWKEFWNKLKVHPGVPVASIITLSGFVLGLEQGLKGSLFGGIVMSLFWIPVLITAWKDRYIK